MLSCNQTIVATAPSASLSAKYTLFYGPTFERSVPFNSFSNALCVHRFHVAQGIQSRLVGAGYEPADGDGSREFDGLTADERDLIELAELELAMPDPDCAELEWNRTHEVRP